MNSEWPKSNTEMQKTTPEKKEKIGNIKNLEQKLSPEQTEQIMAKVQDINEKGTGYHALRSLEKDNENYEPLKNTFRNGILGVGANARTATTADEWKKNVRGKDAFFYFNIVGKSTFDDKNILDESLRPFHEFIPKTDLEIPQSYYFRDPGEKVIFLFDISGYQEENPYRTETTRSEALEQLKQSKLNRTYRAFQEFYYKGKHAGHGNLNAYPKGYVFEEKDKIKASSDCGYMGSFRIPPRLFRGIVLKVLPEKTIEEEKKLNEIVKRFREIKYTRDTHKEQLGLYAEADRIIKSIIENKKSKENLTKKVSQSMLDEYENNPKLLLPIYDQEGNLLWPKKLRYEEVKKFIAEKKEKN